MIIKPNTLLRCGCCGDDFKTWEGYINQDQDKGYGICKRCQESIEKHDQEEMNKAINTLRNGLNEENRAKLDAMDRELQEAFVWQALEDDIMKFSVGGRE